MKNRTLIGALVITAVVSLVAAYGSASQQYPVLDKIANKIVQKYQTSTCDQLWQERSAGKQPKSPQEQQMIDMLRNDPQKRTAFINQIAAPVVNKMFECGMVP